MPFCTECGAQVADGIRFCTECGATINQAKPENKPEQETPPVTQSQPTQQAQSVQQPQPVQQPVYVTPIQYAQPQYQPVQTNVEMMTVGQWIKTLLLLMIPIAGFFILIVWVCGGSKYQTRINYARGSLITSLILSVAAIIISIIFAVTLIPLVSGLIDGLSENISGYTDYSYYGY